MPFFFTSAADGTNVVKVNYNLSDIQWGLKVSTLI